MRKILASMSAGALLVTGIAGLSVAKGGQPAVNEDQCQHYSLKGNSGIDKDETPAWPADYWQANTKQEPHLAGNGQPATWLGVEGIGLHYTSNESSGKRDWFYYACEVAEPSPEPSETPSEEPSETPSEEPSETPSETPSEEPSEEPTAQGSPEPTATVTETAPAPTVTAVVPGPTVTATEKASPAPTVTVTKKPRPKAPKPATTTPSTPKQDTSLPKCEDVAKEQAGKTYAKDSPEANGTACR
jgi:hypothetical protein